VRGVSPRRGLERSEIAPAAVRCSDQIALPRCAPFAPPAASGFVRTGKSMRLALGLLLVACVCGCQACGPQCGSACGGPAGCGAGCGAGGCGAGGCGPIVCCESHCYCRRLDDCHTEMVARRCACELLTGRECRDYRLGFTQAFVDVALGRTGQAPPVPPERYWSVCFRSACGQDRVADWYAGYREGAEIALARCGGTCQTIPSSGAAYQAGTLRDPGLQGVGWQTGGPLGGPAGAGCPCGRYSY
jgi:hypothetical protein